MTSSQTVVAQLKTSDGACDAGPPVELPLDITPQQLTVLLNDLLSNEEKQPYSFYVNAAEITKKLRETVEDENSSIEEVLSIVYVPQAVFKVRAVTRCTATLEAPLPLTLTPTLILPRTFRGPLRRRRRDPVLP